MSTALICWLYFSQKRKSCTLSQNRSLKNSQSLTRVQPLNSSSKLSNRSSNSSQSKRQVPVKNTSIGQTKPKQVEKKETYKSLESLFDLSKPVELETPNFPFFYPPVEEEKAEVLYKKSHSLDQFGEPNDYTAPVKPLLSNLPVRLNKIDNYLHQYLPHKVFKIHRKTMLKNSWAPKQTPNPKNRASRRLYPKSKKKVRRCNIYIHQP